MALIPEKSDRLTVIFTAPDGDEVTFIFETPTDEEKDKFRRKRLRLRGNKLFNDYDVDVAFVNRHLVGCENVYFRDENKNVVRLDPAVHTDWKQRIPRDWKLSVVTAFLPTNCEIAGGEEPENF